MKKSLFHGAVSEIVTPFTETGEVDYYLLEDEVEYLVEHQINGFFVNGFASEALIMSRESRIQALDTVLRASDSRVPVMGNIISTSLQEAKNYIDAYMALGVDAIALTPPLIYKCTEFGLYAYFMELAEYSSIPVYIYNAPETGNTLGARLVARLFRDSDHFRGYKDSTQNITELQMMLSLIDQNRQIELLAGTDAHIVTTMMLGGSGVISLIATIYPEMILETVQACEEKDWDKAIRSQAKVLRVREALKTGPYMAAYKYASKKLGRPLGVMKPPLSDLNEEKIIQVHRILEEYNLL